MSVASQHTPGEWFACGSTVHALDERGVVNRFSALIQGGYVKRNLLGPSNDTWNLRTSEAELEANARLIAASPDLLEALVRIEKLATLFRAGEPLPKGESFDAWLEQARAAIAKAVSQ